MFSTLRYFVYAAYVFVEHGLRPPSQRRLAHPGTAVLVMVLWIPAWLECILNPPEQEGHQLCLLRCLKPKPRECHRKGEWVSSIWLFSFEFSLPQRGLWAAGKGTGKWAWGRQDSAAPASASSLSHRVFSVPALPEIFAKESQKNFSCKGHYLLFFFFFFFFSLFFFPPLAFVPLILLLAQYQIHTDDFPHFFLLLISFSVSCFTKG